MAHVRNFYDFYGCLRLQVTVLSKLLSAPDEVIVEDPRQAWLSFQRWTGGGVTAAEMPDAMNVSGLLFHCTLPIIHMVRY